MDGFSGFKSASTEELPEAVPVMDPFHVIRLAGDALDVCRRRVQQVTCGHRGRAGDPLYKARRTLHTGSGLLTDKQRQRLQDLFTADTHVEVEATWGIYQRMITAYREPDRAQGKKLMQSVVDSLSTGVPATLTELKTLGRTLKRRAADMLAYSDRTCTLNSEEPLTSEQRLAKPGDKRRMGRRTRSNMLLDVIDALIATGIRPGEVLAIRTSRLFLTEDVPYVRVDATVIRKTGEGLVIQEQTKAKDVRILALPKFAVDLFMRILVDLEPNEWDVVFPSSAGTLMDPRNLRHAWTKTFAGSEFEWVTAKTLRKSVATLIDLEHGSADAAKQLGHASDSMTKKHYIEPSRLAVDQRLTLEQFRQ